MISDNDDDTSGKKPPAPSVVRQPVTLILRPTAQDDYAVIDPDIARRVGRVYRETIRGEPKWMWSLQTDPAPPLNSGMAATLEEAAAAFKRRYQEVKART
jgi:hypothetical protein